MFRSTLGRVTRLMLGLFVLTGLYFSLQGESFDEVLSSGLRAVGLQPGAHAANGDQSGIVALSAGHNGHFNVSALINGKHVSLIADTGASLVVLNYDEAARLGLEPETLAFTATAQTANGPAKFARAKLDVVRVGGIEVRNVRAAVAEPGRLSKNLLGMSFIGRLTRFEMKGRQLVLYD